VTIANPTAASLRSAEAFGTILDAVEGLSVGDASVAEGNAGTTTASFTVTLARASATEVRVDYASADDSARAWDDYSPIRNTLVFAPGEQSKIVTVGVLADVVPEPTEYYSLSLANAVDSTIGWADGTGTILDDDGPLPPVGQVALSP
jgi:hypothetical protein